jgi:hypothetical protein
MHLTILHDFFPIPVGLALAFMLWVLWNVTKQLSGGKGTDEKQPTIAVGVRDRYSASAPAAAPRLRNLAVPPSPARGSTESSHVHSASREFSRIPSAPVLGTGLRQAPNSAGRDVRR